MKINKFIKRPILNCKLFYIIMIFPMIVNGLSVQQVHAADLNIQFSPPPTGGLAGIQADKPALANGLGQLLKVGQYTINGLIGFGLLLAIIGFSVTAFKLARGNVRERKDAIQNLSTLAVTTAALGAFPLILSLIIAVLKF